ncbi:MAG: hypothetical protein IJK23_13085 [Clostridia bacterium]|nr:hypothetical protein [Clostridia bacterium]
MKKTISVLLASVLIFGMLFFSVGRPALVSVRAENGKGQTVNGGHLIVNGEYITDQKLSVACGGGTAEFDPKTNTLTLTDAEISKAASPRDTFEKDRSDGVSRGAMIVTDLPLFTVALKGKNVFASDGEDDLRAYGDLAFTGDGGFVRLSYEYQWNPETERDEKTPVEVGPTVTAFGNVSFENADLSKLRVFGPDADWHSCFGSLTVKGSVLSEVELIPGGEVRIEDSTLTASSYEGSVRYYPPGSQTQETYEGTVYRSSSIRCADSAVVVTGSRILHAGIETDGDISLADLQVYDARFTAEGTVAAENVTTAPGFSDPAVGLFATQFSATEELTFGGKNALWNAAVSGGSVTVRDTVFEYGLVSAREDLTLDGCEFYGTDFTANGALLFKDTKADAKDETQDSRIEFDGTKAEFINCDFGGIAETLRGERQVYIGNGLPMVESLEYNTLTGVSIFVWAGSRPEEDVQPTILLKDSRLIMSRILTYTPDLLLTVDETRLMICAGELSYQEYDYAENVTIKGNIDIVTGYWGSSNETGIFIDYLGDYYTFDKDTGTVNIYNHYGAYGFRQDSSEYVSGEGDLPTAEYANAVKKIIVGDQVENPPFRWFMGFNHLKELDFGDGITELQGGYPDWTLRGCTALEKVAFGSNMEYFDIEMLTQCPNLKEVVIRSEKLNDTAVNEGRWGFQSYNPDVKIYVPASQVERFKEGFPHYKDQIFSLDGLGGEPTPTVTEPAVTEPTVSESTVTEPPQTGPAVTEPSVGTWRLGDANTDGRINSADARLLLRIAAKLEKATELQKKLGDLDENGRINSSDARTVLRIAAKLIPAPDKTVAV